MRAHLGEGERRPLAPRRHEAAKGKKLGDAMPCEDGADLIAADNEIEVHALAMRFDEVTQRIVGI